MSLRRLSHMLLRWLMLACAALLLFSGGRYALRLLTSYERDTTSLDGAELGVQEKHDGSVKNIALFGVDASNGDTRRSDCMMVLSVDGDAGKVRIVSLMRDSRVQIAGHGESKLNHAYSYGGPALAIRTINETFDLDIEHFAQVDFSQMANLIGALGGVTIDVKEKEIKELNKFIGEYCRAAGAPECPVTQAGSQTLNGIQAMSYGRIRKGGTGDDWGRVERQGIVLQAMFDKVRGLSPLQLVRMAPTMLKYVTTDLSVGELTSLALTALRHGMPEIEHGRIPVDGMWSYGGSQNQYIVFDTAQAAQMLNAYFYEDTPLA